MATAPNNNINIPQSPFLNALTGRPNQEWLLWLMNPNLITLTIGSALSPSSGGTGLPTNPANGQLLIGNGTAYVLNTLNNSSGISIANGSGTISIGNTGVLSFNGGTTGLTPTLATAGAITLGGILVATHGGTGHGSYAIGDTLYANSITTLATLPKPASPAFLTMNGGGTPSWKIPSYGAFFDTTTQAVAANTRAAITFNSTQISSGISIGAPTSRIVVSSPGTYNIQIDIELVNPTVTLDNVIAWMAINGTDVANSASQINVLANNHIVLSMSFMQTFGAGDYFEIFWLNTGGNATVGTFAASGAPVYPATPSIKLTISNNISA